VFEDLHWADETLLQFIEYLARYTEAVAGLTGYLVKRYIT